MNLYPPLIGAGIRVRPGRWARAVNLPLPPRAVPPGQLGDGDVTGMACPASRVCFGAGSYNDSSVDGPLVESLNGSRWTARDLPLPGGMNQGNATSISCSSRVQCVAVGTTMAPFNPLVGGPAVPTIWTRSATGWTVTTLPLPGQTAYDLASTDLSSVSCPNTGACVAVGSISNSITNGISSLGETTSLPLLLTQTHGRWVARLLSPPARSPDGLLDAISCTGAGSCVVIGRALSAVQADPGVTPDGIPMLFTERDGKWGRASTLPAYQDPGNPVPAGPAPVGQAPRLYSLACVTTGRCIAMGTYALRQTRSGWKASATTLGTIFATACVKTGTCTIIGDDEPDLLASSGTI